MAPVSGREGHARLARLGMCPDPVAVDLNPAVGPVALNTDTGRNGWCGCFVAAGCAGGTDTVATGTVAGLNTGTIGAGRMAGPPAPMNHPRRRVMSKRAR